MRWGMPPPPGTGGPPVTDIRNTSSPNWRAPVKPENRCLVPANSFAEYAPEPNPEAKKLVRFALIAERGGRADPSEDDAGDPDDRRRARRMDARAVGRDCTDALSIVMRVADKEN
jgi:hypothetical protein